MHPETKIMIRHRAEKIGRLASHLLMEYDEDLESVAAFKYAYLALRGPRAYLNQFRGSDLHIDSESVDAFLWRHQERLCGVGRLLIEEVDLINFHNDRVNDHIQAEHIDGPWRCRRVNGIQQAPLLSGGVQ